MYDLAALTRKIKKERLQETINYLLSDKLSDNIKDQLTNAGVFINGGLNYQLLYSLN